MTRYMDGWLLPAVEDANREFFTTGKIIVRECRSCAAIQHPPEDVCTQCGSCEFAGREFAGEGEIYSYTVVRHPVHPDLAEHVPYVVVLVSLAERPSLRITGNLLNTPPDDVRVGLPVRAVWEEIVDAESSETLRLPQWVVR